MNDLIKGELIVDKQIKDEFYLYAFKDIKFATYNFNSVIKISGLGRGTLKKFGYIFNSQVNKINKVNEEYRLEELHKKIITDMGFFRDIYYRCLKVANRDRWWPGGPGVKIREKTRYRLLITKLKDFFKKPTIAKGDEILKVFNVSFTVQELTMWEAVDYSKKLDIPLRYIPKEEIFVYDDNWPLVRIKFKEQIISLMEQKFPKNEKAQRIVKFFKELCARDKGLDFDEYIEQWAKRLVNDVNLK